MTASTSHPDQPKVVALVCSAGGLTALKQIVQQLPADFSAAVVVLQHLAPHSPSILSTLLSRGCRLPVHDVVDGEPITGGSIAVVPPGVHALATNDGRFSLIASDGFPPYRPSADLLLTSLAVTSRTNVIAVVLSGLGQDGATGALAVHHFGGCVIAADEESSEHYAMPAAAISRDHAVDQVMAVTEMASYFVDFIAGERPSRREKPQADLG